MTRWVCCLLFLVWTGCGDSGGGGDDGFEVGDAGPPRQRCVDADGDGYDLYCGAARDCDDEDPNVLDECFQCDPDVPKEGCPCTPGTKPIENCNPEDIRTVQNGVSGVIRCEIGTRYCRDGAWSTCEILSQYATFIPD